MPKSVSLLIPFIFTINLRITRVDISIRTNFGNLWFNSSSNLDDFFWCHDGVVTLNCMNSYLGASYNCYRYQSHTSNVLTKLGFNGLISCLLFSSSFLWSFIFSSSIGRRILQAHHIRILANANNDYFPSNHCSHALLAVLNSFM